MKQYVIDELQPVDHKKIRTYLNGHFETSTVDDLYWIVLNPNLLTKTQMAHKECQPYYLSVELQPESLCCELLVRTRNRVKCNCMGYASEKQRNWFIGLMDNVLEKLSIQT